MIVSFKNVAKSALVMFAVGVALATILPILAPLAGMNPATVAAANPQLWTGMFFGAFGAINAIVTPVLNYVFGDSPESAAGSSPLRQPEQVPQVVLRQEPPTTERATDARYQEQIKARRASPAAQNTVGF